MGPPELSGWGLYQTHLQGQSQAVEAGEGKGRLEFPVASVVKSPRLGAQGHMLSPQKPHAA